MHILLRFYYCYYVYVISGWLCNISDFYLVFTLIGCLLLFAICNITIRCASLTKSRYLTKFTTTIHNCNKLTSNNKYYFNINHLLRVLSFYKHYYVPTYYSITFSLFCFFFCSINTIITNNSSSNKFLLLLL